MRPTVDLATRREPEQPSADAARSEFAAAWEAGQVERVLALFADDAVVTLDPLARRYTTADERRLLLVPLRPVLTPGEPIVRQDGRIGALTVSLASEVLAASLGVWTAGAPGPVPAGEPTVPQPAGGTATARFGLLNPFGRGVGRFLARIGAVGSPSRRSSWGRRRCWRRSTPSGPTGSRPPSSASP